MKIDEIKKIVLIFLGCTAGSVLIQLAAPMILATLVGAASFAVPFLLYHLIVDEGWRIRFIKADPDRQERDESADQYANMTDNEMPNEEDHGNGPLVQADRSGSVPPGQEAAALWYNNKGKLQLNRIIASLYSRGIYECWIRKDGICNFRSDKGYRRAGIFKDYPGNSSVALAKLMRSEGLNAVDQGNYLYIAWAEE